MNLIDLFIGNRFIFFFHNSFKALSFGFLMHILILAAGYATRLYPLTENQPKPLLELGGEPIINYILKKVEKIDSKCIYLITNDRFYFDFVNWSKNLKSNFKINIINDGTKSNEDRLGAIGDIGFVIKLQNINDDLLVIAGDNLFGFSLKKFVDFFYHKNTSIVAFYDLKNTEKVKEKYGVGILKGTKVVNFEEKPINPKSALASTACYLLKKEDLIHIGSLIKDQKADAPGNLIRYLTEVSEVNGFIFDEHWFDIGTFESLEEAKKVYE